MLNGKYQLEVGLKALTGLLNEFRRGNITNRSVGREGLERHLGELSKRWDEKFPGFPESTYPYSSCRGLFYRGKRDAY